MSVMEAMATKSKSTPAGVARILVVEDEPDIAALIAEAEAEG